MIQSEDQIFTEGCALDSGVCILYTLGRKKCPSEEIYSRPGEPWIEVVEVELDPEEKCEIGYKLEQIRFPTNWIWRKIEVILWHKESHEAVRLRMKVCQRLALVLSLAPGTE